MNEETGIEVIETGDGSPSLFVPHLRETYHSRHGALQESMHVFIEHGLRSAQQHGRPLRILELGFGTGLNALLTARYATGDVHYHTLERDPLPASLIDQLDLGRFEDESIRGLAQRLHAAPWDENVRVHDRMTLHKETVAAEQWTWTGDHFDLIYYDAFAPHAQPHLWEPPVLERFTRVLRENGTFITYCAQGAFKRHLAALGLTVEPLPGPPGKREMTRAVKRIP